MKELSLELIRKISEDLKLDIKILRAKKRKRNQLSIRMIQDRIMGIQIVL
jgi:hypothetical protein